MSDDQSREQHEGQTSPGHQQHGQDCHCRDGQSETEERQPEGGKPKPKPTDCECDANAIDIHLCKSEGLARQADFVKKQQTDVDNAVMSHAKVRKEYPSKRHELLPQVREVTEQLERMQERIKCAMPKDATAEDLDRAFETVLRELDNCAPTQASCSVENCDFDLEVEVLELVGMRRKLAEFEAKMATYHKCLLELLNETANLTTRLADSNAAVKTLAEAMAADPDAAKIRQLYLEARVAERGVANIWGGFTSASEYIDKLCRTLNCWLASVDAAATLTGHVGVLECRERAEAEQCRAVADNIVGETLMRYEKDRAAGVRQVGEGTQTKRDASDDVAMY
ncbi:hypothetical protein J2X01_000285 [Arthrobacter ginsengisoli]|uniref:Uncharacterized protein n=1 Tax=Arthrobacter ginsengisoli TaxID=1356565 RepID=A0ABU1U768_9MICC|nr:hypothetical protein [Arthrobacter ginsengisoli]MDR7081016.1 hypothetical protein [Arthrobacter ginsengisoli]